MRLVFPVFAITALVLSGCAGLDNETPVLSIDLPDILPFEDVYQERPMLANVTIHEDREEGVAPFSDIGGSDGWEDRDSTLSYHGLAEIHDEWGQLVPAHVFRHDPLIFILDDFSFDIMTGEVTLSGHHEPWLFEYYFDAADGRFMGSTDVYSHVRSFTSLDERIPISVYGHSMALMMGMIQYMHGDLEAAIEWSNFGYDFKVQMVPAPDQRKLPGPCDVYEVVMEATEPGAGPLEPEEPDPDPYRWFICFDDSMIPLWTWKGNLEGGSESLTREGPGFNWPGPVGEVLPARPFLRAPMDEIAPTTPLTSPIFVPPADSTGDDWAQGLYDRAEVLHLAPEYIKYSLSHESTYLRTAVTGWPAHTFVLPPLPALPPVLAPLPRAESTAWMMLTEEDGMLWNNVHKYAYGEGGHRYLADPRGFESPFGEFPTRSEIGDVVQTASIRNRVPELSPVDPRMQNYHVWQMFGSRTEASISWWVMEDCFSTEIEDPSFLSFDGVTGRLLHAGRMYSHDSGCGAGSAASSGTAALPQIHAVAGSGSEIILPPTADRPFELRFDQAGRVASALGPAEMELLRTLQESGRLT